MQIMSETIGEISKALSVVQGKIGSVKKEKDGYGYKYAVLSDCLDMIKQPLTDSQLALTQILSVGEDGLPALVTMLSHSSGEWIRSIFPLRAQASKQTNEMQALGSGITYLRRYALCSMMGIAQEDDDGVAAGPRREERVSTPVKATEPDWAQQLYTKCVSSGIDVKKFASKFNISSSDLESVKKAVENFDHLANEFKNN